MIVKSKNMTKDQAKKLFNSAGKIEYPNTKHNRDLMKSVVDEYLTKLRVNSKT